jgi:hypothetical protein
VKTARTPERSLRHVGVQPRSVRGGAHQTALELALGILTYQLKPAVEDRARALRLAVSRAISSRMRGGGILPVAPALAYQTPLSGRRGGRDL